MFICGGRSTGLRPVRADNTTKMATLEQDTSPVKVEQDAGSSVCTPTFSKKDQKKKEKAPVKRILQNSEEWNSKVKVDGTKNGQENKTEPVKKKVKKQQAKIVNKLIPLSERNIIHGLNGAPIKNNQTEMECDTKWELKSCEINLDELVDVNHGEKMMMLLWNKYVWEHVKPGMARKFLRRVNTDFLDHCKEELIKNNLYRNYLCHLMAYHSHNLITNEDLLFLSCKFQKMMKDHPELTDKHISSAWRNQKANWIQLKEGQAKEKQRLANQFTSLGISSAESSLPEKICQSPSSRRCESPSSTPKSQDSTDTVPWPPTPCRTNKYSVDLPDNENDDDEVAANAKQGNVMTQSNDKEIIFTPTKGKDQKPKHDAFARWRSIMKTGYDPLLEKQY